MNTVTQPIHHSRYRVASMLLAWAILLGISGCYSGTRHYVRHQPEVEYEFYYYPSHRVYYDIHRHVYHYHDHDRGWVAAHKLPSHIRLNQQTRKKFRIDHDRPWKAQHQYNPHDVRKKQHKSDLTEKKSKRKFNRDQKHKLKAQSHARSKSRKTRSDKDVSRRAHGQNANRVTYQQAESRRHQRSGEDRQRVENQSGKRRPDSQRKSDNNIRSGGRFSRGNGL